MIHTDPEPYQVGSDFVTQHAQHIPDLYVNVGPFGILVQPHPAATLDEQFTALSALASRLGVEMLTGPVRQSESGYRFYTNQFVTTFCGVRVDAFMNVRVEQLAAV